ncbi:MAG: hypothetical protein R2822_28865 [Spirosomataceae bacterium]
MKFLLHYPKDKLFRVVIYWAFSCISVCYCSFLKIFPITILHRPFTFPTCIDASNNLLPAAANLTTLNVANKNIVELTGITGFTSLETLLCYNQSALCPSRFTCYFENSTL